MPGCIHSMSLSVCSLSLVILSHTHTQFFSPPTSLSLSSPPLFPEHRDLCFIVLKSLRFLAPLVLLHSLVASFSLSPFSLLHSFSLRLSTRFFSTIRDLCFLLSFLSSLPPSLIRLFLSSLLSLLTPWSHGPVQTCRVVGPDRCLFVFPLLWTC